MGHALVAGHVNWDVTLRLDRLPRPDGESSIRSQRQSGGGSAANVAVALSRLDVETSMIGSVGDDENGLLARRELEADGVDLAGLKTVDGAETAVKYLLVDDGGQVSVLGNDGVNEAVGPDDVDPAVVRGAEHVHLTSQRPETAATIARIATDADVPVSFDPGRRVGDRTYTEAVALADVLFVSEPEADALFESRIGDRALADRVVVVTAGADGAVVHTPSGSHHHPGYGVESVDSSGAGDAFAAGFVATTLRTEDLGRALAYANACGAITTGRSGARSAPTAAAVDRFLADHTD